MTDDIETIKADPIRDEAVISFLKEAFERLTGSRLPENWDPIKRDYGFYKVGALLRQYGIEFCGDPTDPQSQVKIEQRGAIVLRIKILNTTTWVQHHCYAAAGTFKWLMEQ